MRARLKDVAQLAGVSVKTVSNVVNGYVHVTPETHAKVEKALTELDYRPNISARNLRRGRSGIIALALPSINGPYFAEQAHLVVKEAEKHGLTVLIDCTDGVGEREQLVAEGFRTHLIDGLILCPWQLSATDVRKRHDVTPLVLLGERLVRSADSVAIDSRDAARVATEHLVELGRRRIGVIGTPPYRLGGKVPKLRHQGYQQALHEAGLEFRPELIVYPPTHRPADAVAAMERLLDLPEPVDSVFCFNDGLALGAIRAALARDIRVPEDIAVIGIDDIAEGQLSTPTLSTIAPDKQRIARTAVEMLVERIGQRDERATRQVTADFTLRARESTLGRNRTGETREQAQGQTRSNDSSVTEWAGSR